TFTPPYQGSSTGSDHCSAKNLFHFSPKSVLASHLIPPFDWRYIPVETKADHRHVGLKKHHNAT
ncbi:hypothetical protein, partial [Mycolicibacterium mucogenicum]